MADERRFAVNGYQLAALEWHPGAEHKIISCHGWLDNAASFDVLAPKLSSCHILALDMPGHGHSDHKSPQASYNIWDDLLDILAVADQMGWQRFSLLGHSRGAIIAFLLASTMPDRIAALVMLDAVLPQPIEVGDSVMQLRKFIRQQRSVAAKKTPLYDSVEQAVSARCLASGMSRQSAQRIVGRGLKPRDGHFSWTTDPRLTTASAFKLTAAHNQAFVAALNVPYLLLLAEDGLANQQTLSQFAATYPALHYSVLPGSHHFHMEQQAELIACRINQFIAAQADTDRPVQ